VLLKEARIESKTSIISTYILLDGESFISTLAKGFLEISDEEKLQIEQTQCGSSFLLYPTQNENCLLKIFENVVAF